MQWGSAITYLAETRVRGTVTRFGLKDADRTAHVALMGKRGSGRSLFLAGMALQDIERGLGVLVIDCTGALAPKLLERFPPEARERLIALDPSDGEHPFSWNPLDDFRTLGEEALPALERLLSELYDTPPNPIITHVAEQMLSRKDATLLLLHDSVDEKTRERVFSNAAEKSSFESLLKEHPDAAASIIDRGRYLARDVLMRNILGQTDSKFSFERLAHGGVIMADFSRIRMFPTRIGPLVRLFLESARRYASSQAPVAVYVEDGLRYLSPEALDAALLERGLAITVADTAYGDEPTQQRERLLHRVGSVFSFAPSETDAPFVERVFYPYVSPDDLAKLEEGELLVTLAIDAVRSRPFYAQALPPPSRSGLSPLDLVLESRNNYSTARLTVDKLFRPKPKTAEKKEDTGSFSNAFRSIFAKQAQAGTKPPSAPAPQPKAPSPASAPAPSAAKPAPSEPPKTPKKPQEVPEADLKKMVRVRRIKPTSAD